MTGTALGESNPLNFQALVTVIESANNQFQLQVSRAINTGVTSWGFRESASPISGERRRLEAEQNQNEKGDSNP